VHKTPILAQRVGVFYARTEPRTTMMGWCGVRQW
jgi:hypothetical protein